MSVPANLIEALVAWADDQPSISDVFDGGIYQDTVPIGAELPYLTFIQADSRPLNIIGRTDRVEFVDVSIEARADNAVDARRYGQAVKTLLLNSGPLQFANGSEAGRHAGTGEAGELEDGTGPGGVDVWVHRVPVTFICGTST